jgi:hypothetical protein
MRLERSNQVPLGVGDEVVAAVNEKMTWGARACQSSNVLEDGAL